MKKAVVREKWKVLRHEHHIRAASSLPSQPSHPSSEERWISLVTEDGVFHLQLQAPLWDKVTLGAGVEIPEGDLSQPNVFAQIQWKLEW
jgi:hypothetical protein